MKENKLDSREKDEKLEREEVVESNVPDSRFQKKQQVQKPVNAGMDATVQTNPFTAKKQESSGSQLKQETVAKVITGTGGASEEGVASPSRAGLRTLAYSGNEGTILGNPSGTPVVGSPSRSDTRPGQKLDATAKLIDFIASEQVYQDVRGSKPLQDNPGEVQGFLGHPENNGARVQKTAEVVPGALLYARSCDEIRRDEIAYVEGQMIEESGVNAKVNPSFTYDVVTRKYKPFNAKRGNYIPKTMHLGVNAAGKIVGINFDVDDISMEKPSDIVNCSSSAFVRAMNQDEINRQNMEAKAGIETEKNWCPLVRAVCEPTQTVGFLTDDEITSGSEYFMGYRFINKSQSYFFNQAAKDGQTPYRSFKEMLKGISVKAGTSAGYPSTMINFSRKDYINGAPSLFIALYDSIAKYSKRGDLLTQPRSWKMHKQTADNNINPFRMHPLLAKYVKGRDVFSTIDRGYDPLLPVCISDNWRLTHVQNFNALLNDSLAQVFELKLGGHGATLAGTAFNNIYDDIAGGAEPTTVLKAFASGTAGDEIYTSLHYTGSMNYGAPVLKLVGTKTGYSTKQLGYNAALAALEEFDHSGNNAQLKPIVLVYKVAGTPDTVYAICRYPLLTNVTAAANVKLFISHSTEDDHLNSDTSVNTTLIRTDELHADIFTYKYQNRQNPYIVEVRNAMLYGIREWAYNLGFKLANPPADSSSETAANLRDDQGILWYHIPIVHSTTTLSLWDLILCASVPFAQKIRTNSQYDTLGYLDANGTYPYEQLVSLAEANPLASDNYGFVDILKPLVVGQMKPAVALSWIIPEKFWRIDHTVSTGTTTEEKFIAPFYMCHEGYKYPKTALELGSLLTGPVDEGHVMNFPSVRAGARSAFVDHFFDMTERDIRLCLDIMTDTPRSDVAIYGPTCEGAYRYGLSNSGIPVLAYGSSGRLDVGKYLKTPREIGLGMVAPAGYNSPAQSLHITDNVKFTDFATVQTPIALGTSYVVKTWHVQGGSYVGLHDAVNLVITRGGNFAQDWAIRGDVIYAHADNTTVEDFGTLDSAPNIGLYLNFNDAMEVSAGSITGETGSSVFKPFTYGDDNTNTNLPSLITLQNALWARVQVLPFALSPFDQTPEGRDNSGTEETVDMTADAYDFMYIFGFAGFKASDYREDVYNRIYERQTLGWTYTTDPFVEASPVLK